MRRVILYIAASLDGYIADKHGGVGWLEGDGSDEKSEGSYPAFIETVDTVLLGYTTYQQITAELSPGQWPYGGKTSYVFTHRPPASAREIHFTHESPAGLVNRLKTQPGKDIWICGGASIITPLIAVGLIDRYHITVIPTLLGGGVRLFTDQPAPCPLRFVSAAEYNGMVDLVYEPRP